MMDRLLLFGSVVLGCAWAQMFNPPAMGGSVGCVVTANKLYSHGNYIRDLNDTEKKQLIKYKKDLSLFKEKIEEAFNNAEEIAKKNGTLPPMPMRPAMPAFCTGRDTTLYIFAGCTVQNNKVYIGKEFARTLSGEEKKNLEVFANQMAANNVAHASNGTSATTVAPTIPKTLDFCTEF